MQVVLFSALAAAFLAAPPDYSQAYFAGLDRPRAERVAISRDDGPVILIVVDALRPDRISPYGSVRNTTPRLNELADGGVIFTQAVSSGNWTRPTTASIVSGMTPTTHGVERDRDTLPDDVHTMAEHLRDIGVPTGAVVGNGNAGSAFNLHQGFDFYADTTEHWKGLPSADQVVDLAMPFVHEHAASPFFLMLFMVDPHDPYHAPEPYESRYVKDPSVDLVRTPHWERYRYEPQVIDRMLATYDGAVSYTDAALGRFFDMLRALKLYDKATIIVTADHGEAFGEHDVYLHAHHVYDEIVRVPLIVRGPRMSRRGVYSPVLTSSIDLLPTVVSHYGGQPHPAVMGRDLFRMLERPDASVDRRTVGSTFGNFGIRRTMVRGARYKVIWDEPADHTEFAATVGDPALLPSVDFNRTRWHFYDLAVDPTEGHNVYAPHLQHQAPWRGLVQAAKHFRRPTHPVRRAKPVDKLDDETLSDLRSLGYVR